MQVKDQACAAKIAPDNNGYSQPSSDRPDYGHIKYYDSITKRNFSYFGLTQVTVSSSPVGMTSAQAGMNGSRGVNVSSNELMKAANKLYKAGLQKEINVMDFASILLISQADTLPRPLAVLPGRGFLPNF